MSACVPYRSTLSVRIAGIQKPRTRETLLLFSNNPKGVGGCQKHSMIGSSAFVIIFIQRLDDMGSDTAMRLH